MANSSAQTVRIDLSETNLNMNRLQTEVKQFSGFNKCNGVPFGGMLKPFEKSESDLTSDAVIGADGVKYSIVDNKLVGTSEYNSFEVRLSNVYLQKKKAEFRYINNVSKILNVYLISSTLAVVCYEVVSGKDYAAICTIEDGYIFRPTGYKAYLSLQDQQEKYVDNRNFVKDNVLYGVLVVGSSSLVRYIVYRYNMNNNTFVVNNTQVTAQNNVDTTRATLSLVSNKVFVSAIREDGDGYTGAIYTKIYNNDDTLSYFTGASGYAPMLGTDKFFSYGTNASAASEGFSVPIYYSANVSTSSVSFSPQNIRDSGVPITGTSAKVKNFFIGDLVNTIWANNQEHLYISHEYDATNTITRGYFQCAVDDDGNLLVGYKAKMSTLPVHLLINNNYITGISYKNTLLTDWNEVASNSQVSVTSDNYICYMNNFGDCYIIQPDTPRVSLVDNRYVVTNSIGDNFGSPCVAYDTVDHRLYSYASDWNNRFIGGRHSTLTPEHQYSFSSTVYGAKQIASAVNPLYEVTNNPFPGAIFNPVVTHDKFIVSTYFPKVDSITSPEVDFFYGPATDVSVPYVTSRTKSDAVKINPELIGTTYPTDTNGNIMYCPSMFSEFIRSYNNNSMVVCGSTAYPLNYYNNKAIFSYYLLSAVEGAKHAFSIQGGKYIVTEDQIFSASYSGGVVSVVDSVAYVKDYIYLGADQFKALFYCPFNRVIYAFTGDRLLSEFAQSDKITDIYSTGYNFHSQSIYLSTNDGVYIITGNGICRVDSPAISDFYFKEKSVVMMSADKMIEYSIVDNLTTKLPLELETMFYGAGSEKNSVIDTWYLRLVNNGSSDKEVELYVKALTDKGTTTEIKKLAITKEMWDKETDTILVRYQPKLQRGVGVAFGYKGPFPIQSLTCSVNSQPETTSSKVAI